jgi:GNAT superfamily N-acetyltransferase
VIYKGYDISRIRVEESIPDLKLLHAAHYAETEVHYKKHQVDVNYPHYIACEKRGTMFCFGATVIETRQLVAYLFMYLSPSAHDSSMVATADMFYLLPEHRGSGIARRLLQVAQTQLKELGADYMIVTDKSPLGAPHLKTLFESEGYSQIAIAYSKVL